MKDHFNEDGKLPIKAWQREQAALEQTAQRIYAEYKPLREEWKKLIQVKTCVSNTLRQTERAPRRSREQEL